MEIKHNDATLNRPEGDRVLDAPYVFADLPSVIEQVKNEKAWKEADRNGITIFKTDSITIVVTVLKKEAAINNNTVNGFLTLQVISGVIRMKTNEWDIDMKEKELITFHPGFKHSIEAITDAVLMITTYGVKE